MHYSDCCPATAATNSLSLPVYNHIPIENSCAVYSAFRVLLSNPFPVTCDPCSQIVLTDCCLLGYLLILLWQYTTILTSHFSEKCKKPQICQSFVLIIQPTLGIDFILRSNKCIVGSVKILYNVHGKILQSANVCKAELLRRFLCDLCYVLTQVLCLYYHCQFTLILALQFCTYFKTIIRRQL